MIEKCEIRIFSLVNVHHSEESFDKLCQYVRESKRLEHLNVSWQCLRPSVFHQFLKIIRDNRQLVNLNISWNKILEDQTDKLTPKQIEMELTEVPLTNKNINYISCLAQFIKYNTKLVHLDLSNCGLITAALKQIASFLTKSQGLRCLHLDGNEGITTEAIRQMKDRIKGVIDNCQASIPPLSKQFKYQQFDSSPVTQ